MKVSHIMRSPLFTIKAESSILEAAKRMVERNIGLLVVVTGIPNAGDLVGVVSERDIIKVVASGRMVGAPVRDICTREVITVGEGSDVAEAARAMNKHGIRHVVVLGGSGKPVGVVSMRDLVGERATLNAILQSNEKEVFHGAD
jgi:CBS domain-containing protein